MIHLGADVFNILLKEIKELFILYSLKKKILRLIKKIKARKKIKKATLYTRMPGESKNIKIKKRKMIT